MNNDNYKKSILASATITNKSENQDSKGEFEGEQFNSIFIADGLGSFVYPRIASEQVVEFFIRQSRESDFGNPIYQNINYLYKSAKKELISYAKENIKEVDNESQNLYGTTAITLFETIDKITIAYAGNGGVWHIRGNFNEFPNVYHYPWNALNYLNPHTTPENGKEALYRLISNNSDFSECVPTTIEIDKDKRIGEIIMICTDGIYSADQVSAGKNDKGVWVRYEPSILKFFNYLKEYFKINQDYSKEKIEEMLNRYLEDLKVALDDDATIGILISKEALNYQYKLNWIKNIENNSGN